jgi:hypothetical protein
LPSFSRSAAVAVVYLAVMALWFYGLWKPDLLSNDVLGWAATIVVAGVQAAAGFLGGRWWMVVLPLAAVLVAVPAGYGEGPGQEAPIWAYYAFLFAGPAVVLVAAGVGARRRRDRRR